MFGLLKKQTKLEKFCSGITPEKIVRPLSDPDEKNPQAAATGILFLYEAGKFITEIRNDSHLKKYYKRVNPDLVILEIIIYLHAVLSYSAMDGVYGEDEMEDEALICLNVALNGSLAVVENFSTIVGTENLKITRNYAPNIQSSSETFSLIMEHSCFGSEPVIKTTIDLKNANPETYIGIRKCVAVFSQSQAPHCSKVVENIMLGMP